MPVVVNKDAFDKIVSENGYELTRGVTEKEHATKFKGGEYFAGRGTNLNGTFTWYGDKKEKSSKNYAGDNGVVMRMVLDKNANVISINDAKSKMFDEENEFYETWYDAMEDAKKKNDKDAISKLETDMSIKRTVLADIAKWATVNGYDAVNDVDNNIMVILNRGAVYVLE